MPERPRILRAGERAWLVECSEGHSAALAAAIEIGPCAQLIRDVVPAAVTVLVVAHSPSDMTALRDHLRLHVAASSAGTDELVGGRTVVVPIVYDGPDLDAIAAEAGLSRQQVIALHSGAVYSVAFFGFAPGFAYLTGLPEQLRLPRRTNPRPKVPAGSVAIANLQTAIYPGAMPSGWNQLGTAEIDLWDITATPPNRFGLGDRIVFEETQR
ncbi:allophanate hydrolase subunit 1 [Rhodococcus sp. WS4]|nr:allophanate hydrolase subunit 1 [Rhodococcus sp. WS4]